MTAPIDLVVGLGNPGTRYQPTRHNAGFWFADRLAAAYQGQFRPQARFFAQTCEILVGQHRLRLAKPDTYMNESGRALAALANYFKIEPGRVLVAYDELDLPPGIVKLKQGGGHGGHNGVRDSVKAIGSEFWRLRIGIGHPGHRDLVTDYVLSRASLEAQREIEEAVDDAVRMVPMLLDQGEEKAKTWLHSRKSTPRPYRKSSEDGEEP